MENVMSSKYVDLVKQLNEEIEDEKYEKMKEDEEAEKGLFDDAEETEESPEDAVEVDTEVTPEPEVAPEAAPVADEEKDEEENELEEEEEDTPVIAQGEEDLDHPLYIMIDLLNNDDDPKALEVLGMINDFFRNKVKAKATSTVAQTGRIEAADDTKATPTYLFNLMRDYIAGVKADQKAAKEAE